MFGRALLHADLTDSVVLARSLDDRHTFINQTCQRLLDVDVVSGVERIDGDRGMPVIRDSNENGIETVHGEELAVVNEGLGIRSFGLGPVEVLAIYVAERVHLNVGTIQEKLHVVASPIAETDDPEAEFPVRPIEA